MVVTCEVVGLLLYMHTMWHLSNRYTYFMCSVFGCFLCLEYLELMKYLFFQIPHLRPAEYKRSRLSRSQRTVNRAYGGVLSGGAVRER